MKAILHNIRRLFLKLRLEEATALLFLIPSAVFTFVAVGYFSTQGKIPYKYIGGIWRLLAVLIFFAIIYLANRYKHRFRIAHFIRETLPFGLAIAVYTNLHDTIAFISPGDVSPHLIAIDEFIFGLNPVLWAEKFYHPVLTEIFSFCYMNFFAYSIILAGLLYFTKPYKEYYETMLGVVLLFYGGYFLYILFPAVPPRITLLPLYTKTLDGAFLTSLQDRVVNIGMATSRGAFPSLHCANTLINLIYSWKYKRMFFWLFLPIAIGLVLATVYLRHHYVIDIFAGFALATAVFLLTPKLLKLWQGWQAKYAVDQQPERCISPIPEVETATID